MLHHTSSQGTGINLGTQRRKDGANSYHANSAVLQPLFGKIYHYFSTKWVFIAAVVTFSVASLICALAPNSGVLIAGRTIAGVGSSAIYNGAILMLASIAPLEKRASEFSLFSH
jgi:MFS family permease